jgi:hypothetical protein
MDIEIMKTAGVSTAFVTIIGVIWGIIRHINNKRCHSSCCGRDMDIVVAVNDITEEEKKPSWLQMTRARIARISPKASPRRDSPEEKNTVYR